ncbi:ABC transporter permease [Arthrobacter pigmenti]
MSATATAPRTTHHSHRDNGGGPLTGTGRLIRFALRRDRVRIPVWALALGGLIGYFLVVIPIAYPDPATLQTRADIMKEPAGAMMAGPGYGLDNYTFGAMVSNELLGWLAIASALMSIFLVIRHTRDEEETGRAELIRANVVGRHAPLTAALATLIVANIFVGALLSAAMIANDLAAADSLAIGAGVGLVGLVFGGVAAVTAQLSEHARTASGMAGAALGLAYVLRGVGDSQEIGGSFLSWLSPIGWTQQTRAFVDLRWWPLALCIGLTALLLVAAFLLAARRDVGAGLMAAKRGRANASPGLVHPAGITLRMERGSIIGWAAGLFITGLLTGSIGQGIVDSFESTPQLAEVFGGVGGGDLLRQTMASFLGFFAMGVAVFAVISVNRLRKEESEGRTGAVLATEVTRPHWLLSSLAVTAVSSALLLLLSGFGLGLGAGTSIGEMSLAWDFTAASLAYWPIVLCFAGLAVLAYGILRAGAWWVWILLIASILIGLYGPVLNLPDAVVDAEPFGLVPQVPGAELEAAPLVWMSAVAIALTAAGTWAFRNRDLEA